MTTAYPLKWPDGWDRTPSQRRSNYSRFKTTLDQARKKLLDELRLLGARNVVISSNLELRLDGMPRAEMARRKLPDPGVAVYFTYRGGKQMAMARDAYENVHDNMASIAHAVSHLRGLERHGGGTMMDRAFDGFAALPEPGNATHGRPWWKVFDFDRDPSQGLPVMRATYRDECERVYKKKAKSAHADNGGSHEQMIELNTAIATARKALQ